eukprot:scaffold67063_cov91-Phaeocystis_antarctica.AAC.3
MLCSSVSSTTTLQAESCVPVCVIGIDVSLSPRGGAPRDALASPFAFISRSRAGPSLLCSASCCWLTSPLVTVNTAAGYSCHP